jgi:hypothetical protein
MNQKELAQWVAYNEKVRHDAEADGMGNPYAEVWLRVARERGMLLQRARELLTGVNEDGREVDPEYAIAALRDAIKFAEEDAHLSHP